MSIFYVFDLDGTLIDSERIHYNALGWGPSVTFEEYENILNTTGIQLNDETRKIKNLRMVYEGVEFIPGAEELINHIYKNNLNHVVVTNSSNDTVDKFKHELPNLNKLTNWITREDYNKPKPDPECYILGLKKFYKNEDIIHGFENTELGCQALSMITKSIYKINNENNFNSYITDTYDSPSPSFSTVKVASNFVAHSDNFNFSNSKSTRLQNF